LKDKKTYTVYVQWMVIGKRAYLRRTKSYRNIKANGIVEASNIALEYHKDCICPSVSMVWPNWPQ